jgi:16S rRNA U516 pseudouridylate synthase RsuA-like enzyme
VRVAIGSLQLGKLKPGEYRKLTAAEVHALSK